MINLFQPSHSIDFKNVIADGTLPRLEREYKHSLKGEDLQDLDKEDLAKDIQKVFEEVVSDAELWQAPNFVENSYYIDSKVENFVYFDIYFDTDDGLNYKNEISYRLRERFKSMKEYKNYVDDQDRKKYWPFRIEFQAKVGRESLGDGFSSINESRFEFREESEPFSPFNPPPSPPWDLEEFIGYFQAGKFKEYYTWPAKSVVDYLMPGKTDKTELYFEPKLVLVTERQRQHLSIKTPYGSGPNPEQAFIVTIDTSWVYDGPRYLEYLKTEKAGIDMPDPDFAGVFTEIEVEFERNVSSELDKKIIEAEEIGDFEAFKKLSETRDAFFADQKTIMTLIKQYVEENDLSLVPEQKSKYLQAYELLLE